MDARGRQGLALGAGSGVLYGSINVLTKLIDAHPAAKGTLAYLVSFAVLAPWLRGLRIVGRDWPKVLAMGLLGGAAGPLLLFYGLQEAGSADTGLLLTFEMVATAALATLFLRERLRPLDLFGLSSLLLAAVAVAAAAAGGEAAQTTPRGAILVLASALAWGVDNTVSARLVGSYKPHQLICVKGLVGGAASLAVMLAIGAPLPGPPQAAALAAIGLVAVALSSILFYNALRLVGAARTSAMNIATTALMGAAGGALLLRESLTWLHAAALALVLAGSLLLGRFGRRRPAASKAS
jgi:drug/metabolite transporter (DMT)-like permease